MTQIERQNAIEFIKNQDDSFYAELAQELESEGRWRLTKINGPFMAEEPSIFDNALMKTIKVEEGLIEIIDPNRLNRPSTSAATFEDDTAFEEKPLIMDSNTSPNGNGIQFGGMANRRFNPMFENDEPSPPMKTIKEELLDDTNDEMNHLDNTLDHRQNPFLWPTSSQNSLVEEKNPKKAAKRAWSSIEWSEPMPKSSNFWLAEPHPAKRGLHPVLIYKIPTDRQSCLVFNWKRTLKNGHQVYTCTQCRNLPAGDNCETKIAVFEEKFMEDPMSLEHKCVPRSYTEEVARRTKYSTYQQIKASDVPCEAVYKKMIADVLSNESLDENERFAVGSSIGSYSAVKSQIRRAKKSSTKEELENLPATILKGSIPAIDEPFVQSHRAGFTVVFQQSVLLLASQIGIDYLICNGAHGFLPREVGQNGQIYSINGYLSNGYSLPLFHAVTNGKGSSIYSEIFTLIKEELLKINVDLTSITFIIDFEMAALKSIRKVFPNSAVEGCLWHLALCVNKQAKWMANYKNNKILSTWFGRILALVFLPPEFIKLSEVLENPLVRSHPEFENCDSFLNYFQITWLADPFKKIWNKYGRRNANQITNVAESFYLAFKAAFDLNRNPPLIEILEYLRSLQSAHYLQLVEIQKGNSIEKSASEKEKQRDDENASRLFDKLDNLIMENRLKKDEILSYLDQMTAFIGDVEFLKKHEETKVRRTLYQRHKRATMTEEQKEKVKIENKERQRALRTRRRLGAMGLAISPEEAAACVEIRAQQTEYVRNRRKAMSEEEKARERERGAWRSRLKRQNETDEQRAKRRERDAAAQRARRNALYASETEEQKAERKRIQAEKRRNFRAKQADKNVEKNPSFGGDNLLDLLVKIEREKLSQITSE